MEPRASRSAGPGASTAAYAWTRDAADAEGARASGPPSARPRVRDAAAAGGGGAGERCGERGQPRLEPARVRWRGRGAEPHAGQHAIEALAVLLRDVDELGLRLGVPDLVERSGLPVLRRDPRLALA